jgi:hypothetical protein
MKISLPNLNDKYFRSEKLSEKNGGSGITPSYFPALMNRAIFHGTEIRDRTD